MIKISLWDDKSALYVAARLNGDTNIYELTDQQLEKAKAKPIEQKPLVRKYWATAGELVDLYAAGDVWISNTWTGYQSALLEEKGIKVTEFIPKENAEGWAEVQSLADRHGHHLIAMDPCRFPLSPPLRYQCGNKVANREEQRYLFSLYAECRFYSSDFTSAARGRADVRLFNAVTKLTMSTGAGCHDIRLAAIAKEQTSPPRGQCLLSAPNYAMRLPPFQNCVVWDGWMLLTHS